MSVIVKRAENNFELQGILDLQEANLRVNIDADTAASQGFLTAKYTMAYMEAMHAASPSIIAKEGDRVVARDLADADFYRMDVPDHDLLVVSGPCLAAVGQGVAHHPDDLRHDDAHQ